MIAAIGHLLWEVAQLPLYTVWWTGMPREIVVAVVHCSGGDVLISTATLLIAAMLAWLCGWLLFEWRMAVTALST